MKIKHKALILLSTLVILIFSSCEVGLGAAVDAEAPVMTIDYPPDSSIIKGSFILAGTCFDDIEVKSVTVSVISSETEVIAGTYNAVISGNNWSIELNKEGNYNGFEYADGRYLIDVYTTDTADRVSDTASISVDIDNTAPVLILSKPLAVGSENPSVFGRAIKLAGDISEEHSTTSLLLSIQQWDTKKKVFVGEKKEISITDYSTMSSDNPLVIANYYTEKQINNVKDEKTRNSMTELRNKYLEIYGSISEKSDGSIVTSGDKTFYASVKLTDNAREYKNPGDTGVEGGNSTEKYYINSTEFYNQLMKEDKYSLTATKLRKLLNKTSTEYSEQEKNKILGLLSNFTLSSTELTSKSSKLLVNPDNNPIYAINEYEQGKVEGININKNLKLEEEITTGFRTIYEGAAINITLESGKDGYEINPAKVSVKVYKMNSATDSDFDKPDTKVWDVLPLGAWTGSASTKLSTKIIIKNSENNPSNPVYTDSFYEGGEFYRIVVEGQDIEGGDLVQKSPTGYGFLVSSNSNPPVIVFDDSTPTDEYISGTDLLAGGKKVKFKIITSGNTVSPEVTLTKNKATMDKHISILDSNTSNAKNGIKVVNTADSKQVSETGFSVNIDGLNITEPTPVPGEPGDEDPTRNKYEYDITITIGGNTHCVPTTAGKYKYSFFIKVFDSASKTSTIPYTFYVDNKAPVISNWKLEPVETGNQINGKVNFNLNVSDNYDLEKIEYKIFVNDEEKLSGSTADSPSTFGTQSSPTASFDTCYPDEYGKNSDNPDELKIVIKATDKVGNEDSKTYIYKINQESDRPVLNTQNFKILKKTDINSTNGNVFDKNSNLIGSITDTDGISTIEYTIENEAGEQKFTGNVASPISGALFKIPVPKECGYYQVTTISKDKTWSTASSPQIQDFRKLERVFWIAVDNATPSLSLTGVDGSTENIFTTLYKSNDSVIFTGTASDDWELDCIDVQLDSVNENRTVISDKINLSDMKSPENNEDPYSWSYSLDLSEQQEGSYIIKFIAKDKAGKTKNVSAEIIRDTTPPDFVNENYNINIKPSLENIITSKENNWFKDNSLDIKGYVKDSTSDIVSVEYSLNSKDYSPLNIEYEISEEKTNKKHAKYTGTLLNVINGSLVYIRATDASGKNTINSVGPIQIDITKPSIALEKSYTGNAEIPVYSEENGNIYVNGKENLWIKGTVADTAVSSSSGSSGVCSIYFNVNSVATESSVLKFTKDTPFTEWEIKIPADEIKKIGSSSTTGNLYVLVKDCAGNITSIPIVSLIYDIDNPKAQITKIKYKNTDKSISDANKWITFEGTATDNQILSSVQLYYCKTNSTKEDDWTAYGVPVTENVNNWSIDVDTTILDDKTNYFFRAVAVDSLGNKGNSGNSSSVYNQDYVKEIKINQDSDRPDITFSNVKITGESESDSSWLNKTNDVYVSVNDDDGVKNIYYSYQIYDEVSKMWGSKNDWTKVENGKITLEDQFYRLYFKIEDNADGVFESSTVNTPKLYDRDKKTTTVDTLFLRVDKNPPEVTNRQYYLYDGSNYPTEGQENTTSLRFGGIHNKLKIVLDATDQNGIKSVRVTNSTRNSDGQTISNVWNGIKNEENASDNTWTIEIKDSVTNNYLKKLSSDTYEFKLIVEDNSGLTNEKTFNLMIDNTPAVLVVDSHISGEQVGTDFILKGIVDDVDTATTIKYLVNSSASNISDWKDASEYSGTVAGWRICVDGGTASDESHTKSLKNLFVDCYSDRVELNKDNKVVKKSDKELYTQITPIYFHFLTTDSVGNTSQTTFMLNVDPQGDLPSVTMTYPTATEDGNLTTLSGLIRAQGDASTVGDNTVMGIYMQIEPNVSETDDKTALFNNWTKDNNDKIICSDGSTLSSKYTNSDNKFEYIYERFNSQPGLAENKKKVEDNNSEYGIYIGDRTTWSITLNKNGEFNGKAGDDNTVPTNKIAVRLIIVDSSGNSSRTDTLFINVDSDAPIFGNEEFYVYQYAWEKDGNTYYTNTGNPKEGANIYSQSGCRDSEIVPGKTWDNTYTKCFASEKYTDDMSLKGYWWLSGSVEDDSDIYKIEDEKSGYQIMINENNTPDGDTDKSPRSNFIRYEPEGRESKGYIFNLRVGSSSKDSFGKLTYQIKATEKAGEETTRKSSVKVFSINYDNKAPEVDTSGAYFKMDSYVVNDNGFYTVGTAAYERGSGSDTQSGFARALFYFTKGDNVFDTYIKNGAVGNKVQTNDLKEMNGLYWRKTTITDVNTNTITLDTTENNLHKGGLVYLGGAYYTIKNVSGNDIQLDKNPSSSLVNTPVYYAIGHVVDTTRSESNGTTLMTTDEGYGYYSNGNTDDDFMIESVSNGVTRTVWTGTVNSNNMPDGPATLHYVVFDAAGNYTKNTLDVLVGNNAPRLASVKMWCDFDGNGSENPNGNETKIHYYSERKRIIGGKSVSKSTELTSNLIVSGDNKTAFMTIKDKVTFIPEIVGGNGNLYWSYTAGKKSKQNNTTIGAGHDDGNLFEPTNNNSYWLTDDNNDSYINGHSDYNLIITGEELKEIGNSTIENPTQFNISIWDSSAGSTLWEAKNCLHANMQIALNVQYTDTTAPVVNVKPFFYQNKDNNSLYQNNGNNGHIELTPLTRENLSELQGKIGTSFTADLDSLADFDPKVSGKITIRGTAYDDIRLKELKVKFEEHEKIGNLTTAATYSDGKWNSESEDKDTNMSTNGWTFTATDRYNDERGHLVDWECSIDTSFITNCAGLDKKFVFEAKDERGNTDGLQSSSSDSLTDESVNMFNRPSYRMDVVPYIRRVETSLSSANNKNPSVYDRSSSGHYPVYITYSSDASAASFVSGETIELVGFNFTKENKNKQVTLTADSTSGEYNTTVNGVPTLNNINNNDAKGYDLDSDGKQIDITLSEANYSKYAYNRQANDINNNLLTDDVYLDVWQINNKAAIPGNNLALDMHMKINPKNGLIGFAYLQGKEFKMANTGNSYESVQIATGNTDLIRCASFTYDKLGNTYGAVLPANENDKYQLFSSRWKYSGNKREIGINQVKINGKDVVDKDRYQSASYATLVNANKTTTFYMAFFDQVNGTIRLKSGTLSTGENNSVSGTDDFDANNSNSDEKSILLAGSDASSNLGKAGEYLSIGVTSDNRVVLVWNGDGKLMYAYCNSTGRPTENATTTTWTVKKLMNNGGTYCKLVVDSENHIHIAAYDNLNADLKYYYLSSYSDTEPKVAVVDSYLTIGQNITLDVAKEGDYQIPYIGYWGTYPLRPRYAHLIKPEKFFTASETNGVKNNKYTGVWDCTLVPSQSSVYIDDNTPWTVNIGVWKEKESVNEIGAGKLTNSFAPDSKSFVNSTANTDSGSCYGNGTKNAVISYLRENPDNSATNFIETAQLKGAVTY